MSFLRGTMKEEKNSAATATLEELKTFWTKEKLDEFRKLRSQNKSDITLYKKNPHADLTMPNSNSSIGDFMETKFQGLITAFSIIKDDEFSLARKNQTAKEIPLIAKQLGDAVDIILQRDSAHADNYNEIKSFLISLNPETPQPAAGAKLS